MTYTFLLQMGGNRKGTIEWKGKYSAPKAVFILKDAQNNYTPLTSPRTPLKAHLCAMCGDEYTKRTIHRCKYVCTLCGHAGLDCLKTDGQVTITCPDCNFTFGNKWCFRRHKHGKSNVGSRCTTLKLCPECNCVYRVPNLRGEPHVCGKTTWYGILYCREKILRTGVGVV